MWVDQKLGFRISAGISAYGRIGSSRWPGALLTFIIVVWQASQTLLAQNLNLASELNRDLAGDPLPEQASMRFGTTRLRFNQLGRGASLSPDGQYVYTADYNGRVAIWSMTDGALIGRVDTGKNVDEAVFLRDPSKLLVNRFTGVTILQLPSGQTLHHIPSEQDNYNQMELSPDGFLLASLDNRGLFHLWDTDAGDELLTLQPLDRRKRSMEVFAFSPSSRLVALGMRRGDVEVWDLFTGTARHMRSAQAGRLRYRSLTFLSEDVLLAGGYILERKEDGRAVMATHLESWDMNQPGKSAVWSHGDSKLLGEPRMVASYDRSLLATSHGDQLVLWDVAQQRPFKTIDASRPIGYRLALSPDNRFVAATGRGSKLMLWSVDSGLERHPQPDCHHSSVVDLVELPGQQRLVSVDEEGTARVWDSGTAMHLRVIYRNAGWLRSIAAFPDGEHVLLGTEYHDPHNAGASFKGRAAIVRVRDGALIRQWPQQDRVTQVAVDASGNRIAFSTGIRLMGFGGMGGAAEPARIQVWELPSAAEADAAELTSELSDAPRSIETLRFQGEKLLITDSSSATSWDMKSDSVTQIYQPADSKQSVRAVALAGDRSTLYRCTTQYSRQDQLTNCQLTRINVDSSTVVWEQPYIDEFISPMALSPSGDLLAVSLRKRGQVQLLDTATGRMMGTFDLRGSTVRSLRFSGSGARLYAGMNQGDVVRWDLDFTGKPEERP